VKLSLGRSLFGRQDRMTVLRVQGGWVPVKVEMAGVEDVKRESGAIMGARDEQP